MNVPDSYSKGRINQFMLKQMNNCSIFRHMSTEINEKYPDGKIKKKNIPGQAIKIISERTVGESY